GMLPALGGAAIARDGMPRLFMAGGETMAAGLSRAWRAALPKAALADIYGLTETSTCDFFLPPADQARYPGTIGTPMPRVDYAILDGELAINTPFIMAGYLDAPELTAAAFRDGHFRTGDLAEVTAEGRVRLVGRAKELIHRAGNKVSPLEVERVFLEHPAVAEALATGLPDMRLGEAIHLLIVPTPGADARPAELRAWAAERLDRYKLPDAIHLGAAIPLGRTGKADRAALRAALLGSLTT
ncbi:MAG: ANL family adenylate-forming protein, partial [Acidobacteriota bacterium]